MATEYLTNDTDLKSVADAIRGQTGKTDAIAYPDGFVSEIETLVDTSDADAAASDIASGKTAYVGSKKVTGNISTYFSGQTGIKGDDITLGATSSSISLLYEFLVDELFKEGSQLRLSAQLSDLGDAPTASVLKGATFTSTAGLKVTGTMPNNGAVTKEIGAGETYTIPKGYHSGMGTVKGKAATSTQKETWVLNEEVTFPESVMESGQDVSYSIPFKARVLSVTTGAVTLHPYNSILFKLDTSGEEEFVYELFYDSNPICGTNEADGVLSMPHYSYFILTFDTPPTGDLLTWLQANGVKQASDTAVQESKALTVTSNGTVSVTPDAPYDALKKVDVTVDVASGGGAEVVSLTVKASGPSVGAPTVWYCSSDGVKQVEAYGTTVQCIKNSVVVSAASLNASVGLSRVANPSTEIYIYQITDNTTAVHGS